MLNQQKLFNKVRKHLMAMEKQSVSEYSCAYRGENGAKCAIGILIKDKYYNPEIEGKTVANPFVKQALLDSGVDLSNLNLLCDLQQTHDEYFEDREERLQKVAEKHGLKVPK